MAEKKDITRLSKVELLEMLQRQEKILQDRTLIHLLPDKGQKIHDMVKKLKAMINKKERTDDLSSRFQQISLSQKIKKVQQTELDSDDDEDDNDDDDDDIRDVNMDDKSVGVAASLSPSNKKSPEQTEGVKDKNQNPDKWAYDSAVTYARKPKFEKTKIIPVEESVKIQQQQKEEYEALRAKEAAERLTQHRNPASSQPSFMFTSQEAKSRYRDTVQEDECLDDEEHSESEDVQDHEDSGED